MNIQYKPFDLILDIKNNNFSYTHSFTRKITETDEDIEKLQNKAASFKKNVKKLKRYSAGGISRDLLETQVDDLLKSYNDMKNSSSKVTDEDVQKQLSKLEKLFSENENKLKKIGVENINGRYVLDSKTFSNVSEKAINTLFEGHDSFIGQIDKIMRKVDETTSDAQYDISEYKVNQTHKYNEKDMTLAALITLAGQTTSTLISIDDMVQSGQLSDTDAQKSMKTLRPIFAQSIYNTDSTIKNENVDSLNKLCLQQKEQLAKIGLTFDSGQKNMIFDASIDMTTADFRNAYHSLFGKNASFGKAASEYCKDIFNDILQPDKIGVSIIDAQA